MPYMTAQDEGANARNVGGLRRGDAFAKERITRCVSISGGQGVARKKPLTAKTQRTQRIHSISDVQATVQKCEHEQRADQEVTQVIEK